MFLSLTRLIVAKVISRIMRLSVKGDKAELRDFQFLQLSIYFNGGCIFNESSSYVKFFICIHLNSSDLIPAGPTFPQQLCIY